MKRIGIIFFLGIIGIAALVSVFSLSNKLPIPSDALVGLYHPYRDYFQDQYSNGIPFKNFLITDPVRQQFPLRHLAVSEMFSGSMPLWNPYTFSGTPLLASMQSAPLYPLNMLFMVLPFEYAWSVLVLLQPVLMGIFLYAYLRNLKLSRLPSILGGLAYGLSGFSVAWMEWNTIGHTALWLPVILLCIDKIFCRENDEKNGHFEFHVLRINRKIHKRVVWSVLYLFSLCSAFFAGHLQTFLYLFVLAVVYSFFRILQNGNRYSVLKLSLVLYLLFAFLTAVFWIPLLQFLLLSGRQLDLAGFTSDGWFIPYAHLIQFLAPDFFGNPATLNYFGTWNYGEMIGYVGMIPLLMAVFAVFFVRRKIIFFYTGVVLISLLFALQTPLALIPFTMDIPFLSTAQPTRLLFLIDFSLAVLCAFGFSYFAKEYKKFGFISGFFLFVLGVLWVVVLFFGDTVNIGIENISVAKRNLILPTMLLGITIVGYLLTSIIRKNRFTVLMMVLFLTVTLFDLTRFAEKFLPFTEASYLYPQTETFSMLQRDKTLFRTMTTDDRILPPNVTMMYKIQTIDGYDPLYLKRYAELVAASERGKPDITPPFGFNRIITPNNFDSPLMDLLGVKYVLALSDIESEKLTKIFEEGQTKVYENSQAFDRAFFVENILLADTKEDAITLLFSEDIDFKKTAVVEIEGASIARDTFSLGSVEIIEYSSQKVRIKTENGGVGFLVLMDSYYPTWKAVIDGAETEIVRTNYNFRGVLVPSGVHTVEFYNTLFAL